MVRRKRMTMLAVYSNHDLRSNLEIDHSNYPMYFENYLINYKPCNGFVKQIDRPHVQDLKKCSDTNKTNGNVVVQSTPTCSTCESSSSTSKSVNNVNIRPPCVTITEESMPLMNVKWPVNNGGFVGIEIEDAL